MQMFSLSIFIFKRCQKKYPRSSELGMPDTKIIPHKTIVLWSENNPNDVQKPDHFKNIEIRVRYQHVQFQTKSQMTQSASGAWRNSTESLLAHLFSPASASSAASQGDRSTRPGTPAATVTSSSSPSPGSHLPPTANHVNAAARLLGNYQQRIIYSLWHPHWATYSDPLVTVHGQSQVAAWFHCQLHPWLLQEAQVQLSECRVLVSSAEEGSQSLLLVLEQQQLTQQNVPSLVVEAEFTVHASQFTWLGTGLKYLGLLPPVAYLAGRPEGCPMKSRFHWIPAEDSRLVTAEASANTTSVPATNPMDPKQWLLAYHENYYEVHSIALLWPFYTLFWLLLSLQWMGTFVLSALLYGVHRFLPTWYPRTMGLLNYVQPIRVFPLERPPDPLVSTVKCALGMSIAWLFGGRSSRWIAFRDRLRTGEWAALSPSPMKAGKIRKNAAKKLE